METTTEFSKADFCRAAMIHSLEWKTDAGDFDTFAECVRAVGPYNDFEPELLLKVIEPIFGSLMRAEVGRESSPVIYLYLPFFTTQQIGRPKLVVSEPIPEAEREQLERAIRVMGLAVKADEIDRAHDVKPYCMRLWWD